jgi:acetoin utilization deacetylase AcuC-like enzyme/GNAT superfamily N-acetyltransferase
MIRFRQLHDLAGQSESETFSDVCRVFRAAFPAEPEGIERVERLLNKRAKLDFDPVLLVSEDRGQVTGVSFTFYFSELRLGYLQYIASDPERPARGIGGALYEATRELIDARGGQGLLLDVPPDIRSKVSEPARLPTNRRRIRFYERFGARVIEGTGWEEIPNPRNDNRPTLLMFDGLGRLRRLDRKRARAAVRRILTCQYGFEASDPFVEKVSRSFEDDPVRFRKPTREATERPRIPSRRIRPISVVAATAHTIHHIRQRGYVERPVRVRQILRGLDGLPVETVPVRRFPEHHLTGVHDAKLVGYLKALGKRLNDKAIVYPEVFPIRRPDRAPKALEDRAGYFCADTFTPITHNAYTAARHCVDVALTAAHEILAGARFAYALCRPPGHHAERRVFGGFCYFNNAAIAANLLAKTGKVALLDIDYHHGNGAQDIFYARSDVYTLSIHGHPRNSYPYFSGYADERGEGAGLGFNRNWPLEPPVADERYVSILEEALAAIRRFGPRYLVVSLGFDIMRGDPTGSFAVTVGGLDRIARMLAALRLPTLIVQEGGYAVRNLRIGSRSFFTALAESWFTD